MHGYEKHHEAEGLQQGHLSGGQATALAFTSFIPAVGLASAPALALVAGYAGWLSLLVGTAGAFLVGLTIRVFASRFVVTGTLYSYVARISGERATLLTGAGLVVGYLGQMLAITLLFGIFSGSFLLSVGVDAGLDLGVQLVLWVLALGVGTTFAYRGLDASLRTTVALAVVSVPIMLVITVATALDSGVALGDQLTLRDASLSGVLQGVAVGAAWFAGFESVTTLQAETKDPTRSIPRALLVLPLLLGGLYVPAALLQTQGLLGVTDQLDAGVSPPAALANSAGLGAIAEATDLVLALATFAALIGFLNYGPRLLATLATDGLLPRRVAGVHPRFRSPAVATVSLAGATLLALLALRTFESDIFTVYAAVATIIVYAWSLPYVLMCVAAVVFLGRRRALGAGMVIAALAAAVTWTWVYVNGIVNPPAPPLDSMSYVTVLAVAVVAGGLVLMRARRR